MAKVSFILDTRRATNSGTFPIKLKVSNNGIRKYYKLDSSYRFVSEQEWLVIKGFNPPKQYSKLIADMKIQEAKALSIIRTIPLFTFAEYDSKLNPAKYTIQVQTQLKAVTRDTVTLKKLFTDYTDNLYKEERLGYAGGFETTWRNLIRYNGNQEPNIQDITVDFLRGFQHSFTSVGKSLTTVGIQLRNLRTIINIAKEKGIVTEYPFGKRKYQIPVGGNIKKAVSIDCIEKLYKLNDMTSKETIARDLFYFSYLCNGMNLKDILYLKPCNIADNTISFRRAKTIRKNNKPIEIPITERIQAIIDRYSVAGTKLLFPFINPTVSAHDQRNKLKVITKLVNEGLGTISSTLKLPKKITTYTARHTFSTVLQRSGAPISFISEALGHSNLTTTQNYLAGFDIQAKKDWAKHLIR